jgi:hypothetical protein
MAEETTNDRRRQGRLRAGELSKGTRPTPRPQGIDHRTLSAATRRRGDRLTNQPPLRSLGGLLPRRSACDLESSPSAGLSEHHCSFQRSANSSTRSLQTGVAEENHSRGRSPGSALPRFRRSEVTDHGARQPRAGRVVYAPGAPRADRGSARGTHREASWRRRRHHLWPRHRRPWLGRRPSRVLPVHAEALTASRYRSRSSPTPV